MPTRDPLASSASLTLQSKPHLQDGHTYLFASPPATPKDKPADILVRFQAVGRDHPTVDAKSIFISSRCTLLETRRILHKFFSSTYDRGFIFLRNSKEVLRHKERALRLIDVMPHLPLGVPADFFKFPDVQYKKLTTEKDGRRVLSWYAGIIFLYEKSTQDQWQGQQLRRELCADRIEGFSFLPANIMSAKNSVVDTNVDNICELAGSGKKKLLAKALENLPEDIVTEAFRDHVLATPLHYAACNGHVGVAEILHGRLGNEALHVQDWVGRTPLHRAIYSNKLDMISYLLHLGPDLKAKDSLGNSCLRLMTYLYDGSIEYLMTRVEPYVLDSTLLLHFVYVAFQTKNAAMCKKFCQYVHPVNAHLYRPFLHQAAEMGDAEIVQILLQQRQEARLIFDDDYCDNISILSEETYRRTNDVRDSQNYADFGGSQSQQQNQTKSSTNNVTPAKMDKSNGKNDQSESATKKKSPRKKQPPQFDVISDLDVILDDVGELVHRPDVRDTDGHLPLHYACQHGKDDVISLLYYDYMESKDFVKGIKLALGWRRYSTIQCLISVRTEFVLDPNTLSIAVKVIDQDLGKRGRFLLPLLRQAPLILTRFVAHAAATNDTDVLTLLFNMNVPLTCADLMGRTPLHEACQHGKEAAMRFLMLHGADPTARDWRGSTPFHYACQAGQLDIVCVMAHRESVNVASLDACQRTPLLVAAQWKQFDVVLYLVVEHAHRVDLMRPDFHGDSLLHHLADFESDMFNIVLEAAIKVKDVSLSTQKPFWPFQHPLDNTVIEAWSDPSVQLTNQNDDRADVKRRRSFLKATRITCLKCKKSFTTLRKDGSWSHLCSSPLALGLPQVKPRKRPKVTTTVKPPSSKDTNDSSHFQRSVIKFPSRPEPKTRPPINNSTPLDALMLLGKNDLIPTILSSFPAYRRVTRTALLAARSSNIKVLTAMHKAEGFSKDAFTHLLHVSLVRISRDKKESDQFLKFVKFLLKSGASPNYIPVRGKFDTQIMSPSEIKLIPYMPLEIAAMTGNESLVDILLEFEASASISFAVHLAAIKGHVSIVQKLLPYWKEGRWKPYIKGFKDDPNELVRVCTLESGLVQAVCVSEKPSLELLECIREDEKGVYSCKKILTHHMVNQLRPEICSMSMPSLMNKVLYKHAEDVKGDEHICQNLFLTNLLMCKRRFLSAPEVDVLASFLVDNDCYLGEIRVSKKSTIHVVCESFIVAVRRRMWKTAESILIKGGNTLWKCLLVTHHTCHKFAYAQWMESSSIPCLSKGMWNVIHAMPLSLLEIFLEIGKRVVNRHDMKSIKEKIMIDEDENVTTTNSKNESKSSRPENMLRDVILYHVRNMNVKAKGKLLMLSKLTTLLPDIFPITLESIRFSHVQSNWFTAAGIDPDYKSLRRDVSTSKLVKQLRLERLEIRLWTLITSLSVKDVLAVQERDLSLLHIACLQNDLRLASACMTVVVPLAPDIPDNTGVTPMDVAASRANMKIMEILKQKGGTVGPSVLVAACVGKGFMVGLSSAAAAKQKDSATLQSSKSTVLNWLFTNFREKLNLAYKHADHGTMFDVMLARHAWSLLDWTLDNAGTDACSAVMIRSPNLTNLAYTPMDLMKKIVNDHPTIVEKMPRVALKEILLRLSAFPQSSTAEFLLKKALTLKRLHDLDSTLAVLGHTGKHGESLLHNACRTGNTGLVKMVIATLSKVAVSPKQIRETIDKSDKSGCTPLWYSLAFRSWKIAEYLIVNGAQTQTKRTIPGLYNKRLFEELSVKRDTPKAPSQRSLLAQAQLKRADSVNMADRICPASLLFKKYYGESKEETKVIEEKVSFVDKLPGKDTSRSRTPREINAPLSTRRKQPRSDRPVRFTQDDMEGVGTLATPRTPRTPRSPRAARAVLPDTNNDVTLMMSPRVNYPDETDDEKATKLGIQKRKRVRYLLSLVDFTRFNKGTLVHAACAYGNSLLLKGIMACPLVGVHRDDRSTFSPLVYSIINNCPESTLFCIKNELGPYENDPFSEVLSNIIMKRYSFDPNHKTLKRLLNRFTIAKETIRGIKIMLLPMSESIKRLSSHGTLLTTVGRKSSFDDETIGMLIQMAIKHNKGEVHNRLLMAIAATGRHMLLSAVMGIVTDEMKQTEIFKRKVVHNATLLDLLFILSPTRLANDILKPNFEERMKIIGLISHVIRLDILSRTLSAAVKKNLLPMLEMIVQDFTRNNVSLQSPELWYDAIFKAASNGDISFINTICVTEMNTKTATVQAAMLKALCLACQRRHRAVANRLLLFKMPLHVRVEGVPGRYAPYPRLALDCAIEGGDAVIASLVLQTMEETGMYPSKQDMLQCITMAFDKGMEPIVDNLLQFAHYSSPSLVTLRICHWLYLSAARRGNGMVCSKFLDLPDFKVGASDDAGFTALHYASMHRKSRLIKQICQRDTEAINARTPDGLTALDLARAFGHTDLAMEMITSYGAMQGTGFDMIVTQGWLKRFLKNNAANVEGKTLLMSPAGTKSRGMSIVDLLRQGNDVPARCLLEVAQESVVACMLFDYEHYPLIHLCAKNGCFLTLEIIIQLFAAQPRLDLHKHLSIERGGKIPLCVAIENCNIECVQILFGAFNPVQWRYKPTGESILHFAAKCSNDEIINMVTQEADQDSLQVQDKDGLIPATTAIALGKHATAKYFLNGLRFAEKLHHEHTTTTYWCVLCLLDCCIGWSKIYLENAEVSLNGKGRNIFQRHATNAGFSFSPGRRRRQKAKNHPLNSIHSWRSGGASPDLLTSALAAMQYSQNGFKSELFLLLSRMTRFEALDVLIKKGKTEVACYLYDKLCPSLEKSAKVVHLINAAAYGRHEIVKKILELSGDEISKMKYKGDYSALDVAIGFGHKGLADTISHAFDAKSKVTSLHFLDKMTSCLPQEVRWNLGKSRIGDKDWKESIDYDTNRLSLVDLFLLKKPSKNSFPQTLLPRDIMPLSFKGKGIEVNHLSMQSAIAQLGVDDTWLTSLLLSKAVLGRYYGDIVENSQAWNKVEKIVLHCVTSSSQKSPTTELQTTELHDTIQVEKTTNSQGEATFQIITAPFPGELTPLHGIKERIQNKVIPGVKRKIKEHLYGLDIDVVVDWNAIETLMDVRQKQYILLALEGQDNGTGPLAGIVLAIERCGQMLKDVEHFYNMDTVMNMVEVLSSVTEIQIKFLRTLPKIKDHILIPNDGRISWAFSIDSGRPKYSSALFPLGLLTQMFHTVAVCLHHGISTFANDASVEQNRNRNRKAEKKSKRPKPNPITLIVQWKSFMFLNRLKTLTHYLDTAIAPQMELIGAQYKGMLRLKLNVHTVVISNVTNEDDSRVTFDDGVLKVRFHSYALTHRPWTVSDIDANKVFSALEVDSLSKKWRTGSVNVTASRHRATNDLLKSLGFPIDLPMAGQNVLEMLCRMNSREMTHPYDLLKLFSSALYKHIAHGYVDSVITRLSFSSQSWLVGPCKSAPGVYSWIRLHEAMDITLAPQFLAYVLTHEKTKPCFLQVTKHQLQRLPPNKILGLWYKISTHNIYETLRHTYIGNAQLVIMKGKAFLITQPLFVESFLTSLPEAVSVGFMASSSHTKSITFDEAIARPLELFADGDVKGSSRKRLPTCVRAESYEFKSWQLGISCGFNVIFENQEPTTPNSIRDASETNQGQGLTQSFYISYATYTTLCDVTDISSYEKPVREVMASVFKHVGTVTVGPSIPVKCVDLIHGEEFEEDADVYLVSDRDLHILPMGTMWQGETAGTPFRQTLLVALCGIFLQQTKTRVSHVLAQSLSRAIHPSDIKFKSRVKSAAEVSTLSTTRRTVRSLENAINRILAMTTVGTRKLKMDLTGVEFSERKSGPMVTFDSGVLKCQLFKEGSKVNQKVMDRDFFFAVDEEGGRRMMEGTEWGDSQDGRRRRSRFDGLEDLYSVTSSEVYTINQEGSILEKQRIPKHHSDDSHVVQLAVKRLFSGVEIGRTSDIVDSLDIGANVNSLNDNGETPLIVASRSRNYTTIDLLLTRGAATQMADVLGVTALHYEAGHGDTEAVKLMLSYGADPNAQDQFGRTPLHYAVVGSHQETIDLLVFCGADASIMNKDGESPKSLSHTKAIKSSLQETDLLIRGLKTGNVAIEHLMLQADTIYKMAATGLTIRTPSGMGLSKTSLMVRRVVPEYSLYGPQPGDLELLMSDVYDFRISGAFVEEPLLIQIPIYTKVEQHEDIFVKTDNNVYSSPIKVGRVIASNKLQTPQFMCHVRLCLYGVRSIILVVRPRAETFQVSPTGLDFNSVLDPLVKLQFQQDSIQEECDVTVQVTSKPSYEEEDYDSILSMSHFYEISSSNSHPLQNDIFITLPLPENYLGHGVLHVLMRQERRKDRDGSEWLEILRNPDYARDVVKLRVSSFGQVCLLERARQSTDDPSGESASHEVAKMTTSLFNKTRRREYSACFLAMAKPRHGGKSLTDAEVAVECILSSTIHARLQHWRSLGYVDLKPSHTREFCTVPKQRFLIVACGPCEQAGVTMPPLQFHPKRNNCVKFLVRKTSGMPGNKGCIEVFLRSSTTDSPRSIKSQQITSPVPRRSMDSLQTDATKSRVTFSEDKLASIPIFLQWTAEPGDTRGQDCHEKFNLSPFDAAVIKADIRGADTPLPSDLPDSAVNSKPENVTLEQVPEHVALEQVPPKRDIPEQVRRKSEEILTAKAQSAVKSDTKAGTSSKGDLTVKAEPSAKSETSVKTGTTTKAHPDSSSKKSPPDVKGGNDNKKGNSSVRQLGRLRGSAAGRYIRKISPVRKMSMPSDDTAFTDTSSSSGQLTPTPQGDGGVLDWLAEDLGDDWFKTGVLLGVQYSSLQVWNREDRFSTRHKAMKMLQQWKQTRSFRPDHGVPELFMILQRLGKTEILASLKEKMKVWINENLEKRGCLKAMVNKSLLEDAENLEPMSPLFLLALARKIGFSIDLMYDLGLSRPEVSRVMTDTFLRHREDKMLGLFVMFRDKSLSPDQAMQKLLYVLKQYNNVEAIEWMLTTSRQWLMNHGSADDQFAHAVGQILHSEMVSQTHMME